MKDKLRRIFFSVALLTNVQIGEQLLATLDSFVREHDIEWKNCVGICSDRVWAMTCKQWIGDKSTGHAPFEVCILFRLRKWHLIWNKGWIKPFSTINTNKISATSKCLFKVHWLTWQQTRPKAKIHGETTGWFSHICAYCIPRTKWHGIEKVPPIRIKVFLWDWFFSAGVLEE